MNTYIVQYEIEFDEGLSVNDVVAVTAADEYEAMKLFNNEPILHREALEMYPDALSITANAAWSADQDWSSL
jgi:hypothetical protein